MAALTWRDVAAPSFAGANQAYQGAGVTLDRALSGLSDGLKQFATDQQAGVDNSILARSLQIQDPARMREALASGELLRGVDLTRANPKVLEALNSRVGTLLNQASTEQGIASSKTSQAATQQGINFSQQDQTRKTNQQALEDAARPEQARQLGLTGALAALPTDQQRSVATTNSSLATAALGRVGQQISNEAGSFRNMTTKRDDASNQTAITTADNIMRKSASLEDARAEVDAMTDLDPVTRAKATQVLDATFGKLYAPVTTSDTPAAAKGTGGKSAGPTDASDVSSPLARDALVGLGRTMAQNSTKGVVADIEKNLGNTQSIPEIVKATSELYPEVKTGKLSGIISQAMSDNPGLTAADVSSAINRSFTNNSWYSAGTTSIGDGVGIDDAAFANNLKDLATGKADYMSAGNQTVRAVGTAIKSADKKLADAKADLAGLKRRQDSQSGVDTTRAEERVERLQQALQDTIEKYQSTAEFQPVYKQEKKPK